MTHRDTVANADRAIFNRCSAGEPNTRLDRLGDLTEVDMTRDNFVKRVADTD